MAAVTGAKRERSLYRVGDISGNREHDPPPMTRIYLDHASTTPVIAEAKSAFAEALECWSNPNSPHSEGRECRAKLEAAREEIKQVLGWRHDLIFTSGASEAVEIVGRRARVDGRAHGAVEHAIVPFAMGERSAAIAVDASGLQQARGG